MTSRCPRAGALPVRVALPPTLTLLIVLTVPLAGCQSVEVGNTLAVHTCLKPAAETAAPEALPLAECLRLALEHQPRIAAQRASLAAAEDGKRALETLRFPANLDPQIPVRRQQACLGVTAAGAGVDQAEREVVYAVTRTYFTVLYAREQETVTRGVVERLTATKETAQRAVDAGARDVTVSDVRRTSVYLHLAEPRRTQAVQGVKRARAALAEAIGLGPNACLDVPSSRLPEPTAQPCRDAVVAAALARRGDLVQATIFAQVACLEVEAQATGMHARMPTFAAGTDIHAYLVPQGLNNTEYRPGAVPPEMPTLLVGSRDERVQHAQSLSCRAAAVAETTRNLIALEAEDAFLRWEEAAEQTRQARQAADEGDKLADELSKDFAGGQKVKIEDVLTTRVVAAQARSQYNEYLYRQILALADLERITAGGFCAGLVSATATSPPTAKESPPEEK